MLSACISQSLLAENITIGFSAGHIITGDTQAARHASTPLGSALEKWRQQDLGFKNIFSYLSNLILITYV